ncbi:YD repeat protein, partial [Pseudomonas syringae pv. papulans]
MILLGLLGSGMFRFIVFECGCISAFRSSVIGFFVFSSVFSVVAAADTYSYWWEPNSQLGFNDPHKACDYLYSEYYWSHLISNYRPELNRYRAGVYNCGWNDGVEDGHFGGAQFTTVDCDIDTSPDRRTKSCSSKAQVGNPIEIASCSNPSSGVGNPLNAANGNKYQEEIDFKSGGANPIIIGRSYNSLDGIWRHNFSTSLYFGSKTVVLVSADGRESIFLTDGLEYRSSTDSGILIAQADGWLYRSSANIEMYFTSKGCLSSVTALNGDKYTLTYLDQNADRVIAIDNGVGVMVELIEDPLHQLKALSAGPKKVAYLYGSRRLLKRATTMGSFVSVREYHYEDSRNNSLLTGISDERGVRFATWSYDVQGRAVSSQHGDGAGLTQIAYGEDGASTITNELGKQTIYRYQKISGVKRIVAIEGEPTPDCPASNSTYTYNDRGLVLTKTDAKGLVTTYDYNDRGLEVSRTEASGTTLARTTTTEWDPDRFLPIKVIEPNRITVYSYD